MAKYQLTQPVEAVRYDLRVNEQQVFDLVNLGGASSSNASGFLRVYNNRGQDIDVLAGQWVVRLGDSVTVLDDAVFTALFEPSSTDS